MANTQARLNCAYVFYAADRNERSLPTVGSSITANTAERAPYCTRELGVWKTNSILTNEDGIYRITTKGGKRVGINTPDFTGGVKIYAVAVGVEQNGVVKLEKTANMSAIVPAGASVIITVKTS